MPRKTNIRRIVLDVMKSHRPEIVQLAEELSNVESVDAVNIAVVEIDKAVENIKVTIEGVNLVYEEIEQKLKELGAAIHSIDQVVAGKSIIEEAPTPQD